MNRIIPALLALLLSVIPVSAFVTATEILIPENGSIEVWRLNTGANKNLPTPIPEGQMTFVDLVPLGVPEDAKAVNITALLILTHGITSGTCDIRLTFDGVNQMDQPYIGQALEAHNGGGQRSNMSTVVPVKDGKIGIRWDRTRPTTAGYPYDCAYGTNVVITAIYR